MKKQNPIILKVNNLNKETKWAVFSLFFIYILFFPLYKYLEYVLGFPSVNIHAISLSILIYFLFKKLAINYFMQSKWDWFVHSFFLYLLSIQALTIVFKIGLLPMQTMFSVFTATSIAYYSFYLIGRYINLILEETLLLLVMWVISSALYFYGWYISQSTFIYFGDVRFNYILLADTFALLSLMLIFQLNINTMVRVLFVIVSMFILYLLLSRTSLFVFIFAILVTLLYKMPVKAILLFAIFFLLAIIFVDQILEIQGLNRYLILFTDYNSDKSYIARESFLDSGLSHLYDNWIFGEYLGEIRKGGEKGEYIHNILSFWSAFGVVPFLILIMFFIVYSFLVIKNILRKNRSPFFLTVLSLSVFVLIETIFSRSYVTPYFWLIIGFAVKGLVQKNNLYVESQLALLRPN